jgi:hypothetical protein
MYYRGVVIERVRARIICSDQECFSTSNLLPASSIEATVSHGNNDEEPATMPFQIIAPLKAGRRVYHQLEPEDGQCLGIAWCVGRSGEDVATLRPS